MRTFSWVTFAAACIFAGACGGQTQHPKVEEVPIDQGSSTPTGDLPADEVSGSGARSVVPAVDGSAPPGVGPQSLDTPQTPQDAGTQAAPPTFVQRPNGLTEKQCNDVVLRFAKLMSKEHHTPAPTATEIPTNAIYGQMLVDCGQSTSKKQHKCAMTARTTAGWKKCME